jgi:hypothetical protein
VTDLSVSHAQRWLMTIGTRMRINLLHHLFPMQINLSQTVMPPAIHHAQVSKKRSRFGAEEMMGDGRRGEGQVQRRGVCVMGAEALCRQARRGGGEAVQRQGVCVLGAEERMCAWVGG